MTVEYDHPVAGPVKATGSPLRIDGGPARSTTVPPPLGQDTRRVLRELGVDDATIDTMVEKGTAVVS
jgi:formyl-CoA transferase